jgi:hypothetical protein
MMGSGWVLWFDRVPPQLLCWVAWRRGLALLACALCVLVLCKFVVKLLLLLNETRTHGTFSKDIST